MKRRSFIRNIAAGTGGVMTLGGLPIRAMASSSPFHQAALKASNDNVLIFVQLHGGNDGLNSLVPISQYNEYYQARPNIAIPADGNRSYINVDDSYPSDEQVGLHPDMQAFKDLYDDDKAVIIQNVGYPDMNMSHFRGRDIVFMGLDGTMDSERVSSGWMGRFLNLEYPDYPENYPSNDMEDPIAIEMGSAMSLAFHRENGIPIGLNIQDPQAFYDLINGVGVDNSNFYRPDGYAGDELEYLWQFEAMSNVYAERLRDVYNTGSNSSIDYPEVYPTQAPSGFQNNPLSGQLRLIARLLKGGIKTRIFLCRMGGFDTHANQVQESDKTRGAHAALMYHLSSAIRAFQDDLANLQLEERVLTMTFTEFGRRVYSNDSYGTDHGTSTPVFVFGKEVKGQIVGKNPDLNDLHNGNMKYGVDYRQVYTSVLQDWFGADTAALNEARFSDFIDQRIDLFGNASSLEPDHAKKFRTATYYCYPNPAQTHVNFVFDMERPGEARIEIFDVFGKQLVNKKFPHLHYGKQNLGIDLKGIPAGQYIYRIHTEKINGSGQLLIQ